MIYVSTKNYIIEMVSDHKIDTENSVVCRPGTVQESLLGEKTNSVKGKLRVAVVCNWRQACGISTYSKFLVDSFRPHVKELKIFSEYEGVTDYDLLENVDRCWRRGESLEWLGISLKNWKPDVVLIQHEFGVFPSASHWLCLLHQLENIPYVVTLHSVYEHLDKTLHTLPIKNIVVHSDSAKDNLRRLEHDQPISVIPHGCVVMDDVVELWNTFRTPYTVLQFGFGFSYKGVDRAIEAVSYLRRNDPKFKDIFYCYLCSQSDNAKHTHRSYVDYLNEKIKELDVSSNVAIIQKYNSDKAINYYLRTAKLAIFPYMSDPNNVVYGASGAIRIAMANKVPVIASSSHMFDDIDGVVPRPGSAIELAKEIDEVFSNGKHRQGVLERSSHYIEANEWSKIAQKYVEVLMECS